MKGETRGMRPDTRKGGMWVAGELEVKWKEEGRTRNKQKERRVK